MAREDGQGGQVLAAVARGAWWRSGVRVLVAVSGGADSVALVDALQRLAPERGLQVTVGHVHHGLRTEADEDAIFVETLAAHLGVPFYFRRVDVPAYVAETGDSVEAAARTLRYQALAEMAEEAGADLIATGHTADDQAETVLMRLLRGTGLSGLAGIPAQRDSIVRPLLPVWRVEIEAYVAARGLDYRTDLSNYSTDFTRNRVRAELLPHLEAAYAPRLRVRLHHLAEMARVDAAALEALAETAYTQWAQSVAEGIALPVDMDLPEAITHRLWRLAIAGVRESLQDIEYDHLAEIARLQTGQQAHLPGAVVTREKGYLHFAAAPTLNGHEVSILPQPLAVPGRICCLEAGCCIAAELHLGRAPIIGGEAAVMDAHAIKGALTMRSWQPGDRYTPFGAHGSRKLQDIFVDAGVPRRLRSRIPVIIDEEGIVWLAGFRPADRVKILPVTAATIRLAIEWELNPWTLKPSWLA